MDVSPEATLTAAAPGPDPVTAERLATLERKYTRLRFDMDRMARVMALLEHDLAIERIAGARPTLMGRLGTWLAQSLAQWVAWLSPWTPRDRPRMQRPLA